MEKINIFWFRRDLRINDNHGFYQALTAGLPVVPVFIFDPEILRHFPDPEDVRLTFIHRCLVDLNREFQKYNSALLVYFSSPEVVFGRLVSRFEVCTVFTNVDYEPAAVERDRKVKTLLQNKGIDFMGFKDQIVFHRDEVVKANGSPYSVFTPYSKKWKEKLVQEVLPDYPGEKYLHELKHLSSDYFPELEEIGYTKQNHTFQGKDIAVEKIQDYARLRDFPSANGTSRLGIHLRFGTISIRNLTRLAQLYSEVFLNELIWRNFYMDILWHYPYVVEKSFKPAYDFIAWRNDTMEFERWCAGQTGYPLVDAGMRELNETGYMHNRVRMVVASFLTKHLLIDWRLGEAYFAKKLLDFELASNNGGWQWASGSGCDAAPYFRVFSPDAQTKKFDPNFVYIRKWAPELETSAYPKPIVAHAFARARALEVYRQSLKHNS
jgi:deoxyribodipyrimidine photo-lyase